MHGLNLEASLRPTFLLKEMGNNIDSKAYYASIKTK